MLVRGDNDLVVDVLGDRLSGQVKCIYIDPPYNNMESYIHYEDRDNHEDWLEKLTGHIRRLKPLLTEDGSIWISIDDYQVHYLKVALDNVFGRSNFVTTIIWEHRKSRENRRTFSNNHEYILVYAKDILKFKMARKRLPYTSEVESRFKNPDRDPRGPWQSISLNVQAGHGTKDQFYTLKAPNGRLYSPPNGRCWMYTVERVKELIDDNRIWFGKNGNGVPRLKRFLSEIDGGLTPHTLWRSDEVGTTDSAKKELLKLIPDEPVFDTPKPEQLITQIFQIAASPGDLVLDSFLGSGTSAVVALRNGMRFVGIEVGEQILTHCHYRISRVVAEGTGSLRYLELRR
jgi:adenine-specific DNA-methyltransferase